MKLGTEGTVPIWSSMQLPYRGPLKLGFVGFSLVLISLCLFLRAATLEIVDMTEPTEGRYALIASEMVSTGDWLTPKMSTANGFVPYFGKPPLHFWLTAGAFSLFGMDEWVSRLPSFLSLIGMLILCAVFSLRFFSRESAVLSSLVLVSSGLMFFLSGASVIDVTFTLFLTGTFVAFPLAVASHPTSRYARMWGYAFFFFQALAFLTKGPLAIVLCAITIEGWALLTKTYNDIKRLPWLGGVSLFFLVTAPWFYLAERANPGFLRYFFINENILRFISRDYGDRYGSGHIQPRGTAIGLLFLAFLPWSLVLLPMLWSLRTRCSRAAIREEPWLTYLFFWISVPALFFAFARQLHAGYVLPCIPPLALVTSYCLHRALCAFRGQSLLSALASPRWIFGVGVVLVVVGIWFQATAATLVGALSILIACCLITQFCTSARPTLGDTSALASLSIVTLYAMSTLIFSQSINSKGSSEELLAYIASQVKEDRPEITVVGKHSYGASWVAEAWKGELVRPITLSFAPSSEMGAVSTHHVIIRQKDLLGLSQESTKNFHAVTQIGNWIWMKKNSSQRRIG